MSDYEVRELDYSLKNCPQCWKRHRLVLELRHTGRRGLVVFGGDKPEPAQNGDLRAWPISFTCPRTKTRASAEVTLEPIPGITIVGVSVLEADAAVEIPGTGVGQLERLLELELQEWVKGSATVGRDFTKTMITLCTASIPVLFTVLKFLGQESARKAWVAITGAGAALLILLAGILFALALRPGYSALTVPEFERWRVARLVRMNRLIIAGLATFVTGVMVAIVLFALLLAG